MLTTLIIFVGALVIVDLASALFGHDSRDGKDWSARANVFEVGQR